MSEPTEPTEPPKNYALETPMPEMFPNMHHVKLTGVRINGELGTVCIQDDQTWTAVTSYDTPSKREGFATSEAAIRHMLECYHLTVTAQRQAAEKALLELKQ